MLYVWINNLFIMTVRKKTTILVKLLSSVGTGFYYVTEKSRK